MGAPRCGTTSLWSYLKDHPEIFMSADKELYFFDSDLWANAAWAPTEKWYLSNFAKAKEKLVGEATPSYLRSRIAPGAIKTFSPEARIIIALRNPLDVMHSLHAQGLRYGTEPIGDFETALEADRKRVGRESLGYREFTDYPGQVQRYFDTFGRERVTVIVFEDLKENWKSVCEEILGFLGVDKAFNPEAHIKNANRQLRSGQIQRILTSDAGILRAAARAAIPRRLRTRIGRAISGWNFVEKPRPPMNPDLRRRLEHEYRPKIEQLGQLLARDLSAWFHHSNAGGETAA